MFAPPAVISLMFVGAASFSSPVHIMHGVDRPARMVRPLMVDEPRVGLWGAGEPPKCV